MLIMKMESVVGRLLLSAYWKGLLLSNTESSGKASFAHTTADHDFSGNSSWEWNAVYRDCVVR